MLSLALCICFGLAFTLNIHPVGDGLWFWYATLWRSGQKVYADMHLPLQPLFVLLTAWMQELLGNGWLASKVLAVGQLLAFSMGLWLVAGFLPWKDWQKALLIASVFGLTMGAQYFRFDDYHITGYCFEIYCIYLLLRLRDESRLGLVLIATGLMGAMSGLSIANRLNDGAALFGACGVALLFTIRGKKLLMVTTFIAAAALALFGVIALTGDTVGDWAMSSILHAAAIKGGTGHVLLRPFQFPYAMVHELLRYPRRIASFFYACFVVGICVMLSQAGRHPDGRLWRGRIAAGAGFIALTSPVFFKWSTKGFSSAMITEVAVLACYGLSLWVLVRTVRARALPHAIGWSPRELLLLVPFFQLMAGAMTGGLSLEEAYGQAAFFVLVLPLALPFLFRATSAKVAYMALAALIAVGSFIGKTANPYEWQVFADQRLFADRQWYRHPLYGPMYIEKDQLELMQSMCAAIDSQGPPTELLSITNPYANYFCGVAPWHGYVQTWYDTTSKQTIDQLVAELKTSPPKWIIYQRNLFVMGTHETFFANGQPLPHRVLDKLIVDRIAQGQWKVVRYEAFRRAPWFVIQTRP